MTMYEIMRFGRRDLKEERVVVQIQAVVQSKPIFRPSKQI